MAYLTVNYSRIWKRPELPLIIENYERYKNIKDVWGDVEEIRLGEASLYRDGKWITEPCYYGIYLMSGIRAITDRLATRIINQAASANLLEVKQI